jgi:hypothetical protein
MSSDGNDELAYEYPAGAIANSPIPFSQEHPVNTPVVADDSSLRQAIMLKLKGKAGSSRSATKPDAETSHVPTLQDNIGVPQTVIPLFKVRERNVTIGKCG